MSLDLHQVVSQIEDMADRLRAERVGRQQQLQDAVELLTGSVDLAELTRKIEVSKTTWLVAGLMGSLAERTPLPRCPEEFCILATDGSHIDVDRHRTASCYLINIGTVALRYGTDPEAALASSPRLYSGREDLALSYPLAGNREETLQGALLGVKRGVEECRWLSRLAREREDQAPTLALLDGSLVMWGLSGGSYPEFVLQELLERGFLTYLEEFREMAEARPLALASYISFPRSTEVVNILRVVLCPHEPAD